MSLKNANLDKGLLDIASKIKGVENVDDVLKSIKDINNIDDLAKTLSLGKITDTDLLKQIVDRADFDFVDDVSDLTNAMDAFADSRKGVDGLTTSFKNLGKGIGGALKTLMTNPLTYVVAGLVAAKIAIDAYYEKFEKLVTVAEDSQSTYASTVSEIKTLDSEIETTSAKIAELENQGTLSITDEAELDRLRIQNLELERQRDIKQQLADEQSKTATKDAMEALTLQRTVDLTQQKAVPHGASRHDYIDPTVQYVNTDIVTAAKNEVAALTELRDKRKELLTDDISDDSQVQEFEELDKKISQFETEINTHLTSLVSLRDNFIDQSTGLVKENLTADELDMFNSLSAILDDYNNIDLTPAERELNKIKQFFDGSFGKNQIKDYLLEATENGMSAAVVIERLGVDLESAGLDAQALNEYFRGMRDSAENAKDSVQDYAATISDIETAKASEDQDKNWSTISESYKEAKELLKEGKTGTDNFQMMASFLNPEKVKDLAKEGGKYTADAYQKAFEEIQKTANRWFGEDETKSMENFVNDFKKKGLFDVETDDMGLWDITTNFKTTAEAAEEFGISIEAVETMLDALGAYGYEFEGITFSADALSEYQSYLEGIQTIYDEIDNSELKDRLGEIIDQAKLDDFENNIESLSPEIVAEIEFEYNLAQIDQEIQRLKAQLSGAGYNDSGSNAEIIAANESRTQKWREENSKATKDTGYTGTDETIAKLERSMVGKSDEVIESTQRKIMALQDLRTAYENTFNASNGSISWEEFINSSEADTVFSDLAEEFGVAKNDLEQIAAEGVDVSITGDTTSFYNELTGVLKNDGKTIVMHIDATTEQIQNKIDNLKVGQRVVFNAEVNGEDTSISAYRDINGVIRYVAEDDGVLTFLEEHQNPDGTITYTPDTDAVDAYDYDQDGVVEYIGKFPKEAPTLYGTAKYDLYINSRNGSIPKLTGSELYDGVASGTMLSPAHKDGTAYNVLNTLPAYSTGKVGLSEDQQALVNELGVESIVRDGVWRLLPGGAHLENLKKGDIIFNADQTRDLLRSGKTPGHARAYAQGNVLSPAYRLGNNNDTTGKSKTVVDTPKKTTKQVDKALEELEKAFDLIVIKFERLARASEKAEAAIERARTRDGKLAKTDVAITKVRQERNAAEKGAADYLDHAKKIALSTGLSKSVQKQIQNGSIRMGDYNENTQKKISAYKEAYDNYLAALDKAVELQDKENELALQRLDIITESYDALKGLRDAGIDLNNSKLELMYAEDGNSRISEIEKIYKDSITKAKRNVVTSENELKDFEAELKKLVRSGQVKKGTQQYNELLTQQRELEAAVYESKLQVVDLEQGLREKCIERLDEITEFYDAIKSVRESLINLNQSKIDLMEAKGASTYSYDDLKAVYSDSIAQAKRNRTTSKNELAAFEKEFNKLVASKHLKKDDKEYKELEAELNNLRAAVNASELEILELEEALRTKAIARIDEISDFYDALKSVADSIIDLNNSQIELLGKKGFSTLSEEAKAIYRDSIEQAKLAHELSVKQAEAFEAGINELIAKGEITEDDIEYYELQVELNNLKKAVVETEIAFLDLESELANIEFERIQNFIDALDRASNKLNNQIALMEARDEEIPESKYQEQINLNNEQLEYLSGQLDMKRSERAEYDVESPDYKRLSEEIAQIEDEMYGLLIQNEELKDSIVETRFADVNKDIDDLNRLQSEISDTRSMLDSDDFFDDEGNLTSEGVANITLITEEISLLKQETAECEEALRRLEEAYASGAISEKEYNEMSEEYRNNIRDNAKQIDNLEDSLEDLAETQMEKQREALKEQLREENELLQKNIEKRKEALQRKKDYYDYDTTIKQKSRDINMLRAQIAAMEGV